MPAERRLGIVRRTLTANLLIDRRRADRDHALLMWYAIEPLIAADPGAREWADFAVLGQEPLLFRFIARRIVEASAEPGLNSLVAALNDKGGLFSSQEVLLGVEDALRGHKGVPMPKGWSKLAEEFGKRPINDRYDPVLRLSLHFADARATAPLRALLANTTAPLERRQLALESLAAARVKGVEHDLLAPRGNRESTARRLRSLTLFDDPLIAPTSLMPIETASFARIARMS